MMNDEVKSEEQLTKADVDACYQHANKFGMSLRMFIAAHIEHHGELPEQERMARYIESAQTVETYCQMEFHHMIQQMQNVTDASTDQVSQDESPSDHHE